jgi:hypothetical protein
MGFEPTTRCMASSCRYAVEAYAPALEAGSRRLVVRGRLRDSTPFTGSFRTESGLTSHPALFNGAGLRAPEIARLSPGRRARNAF